MIQTIIVGQVEGVFQDDRGREALLQSLQACLTTAEKAQDETANWSKDQNDVMRDKQAKLRQIGRAMFYIQTPPGTKGIPASACQEGQKAIPP